MRLSRATARVVRAGRAAAAAVVLLASCGQPAPEVLEGADGVPVVATSRTDVAMEARISGELDVVDGCLGVRVSPGTGYVVSWHCGSQALQDELGVRLPDGQEFRVGDRIVAGGGGGHPDSVVSEACPAAEQVWTLGEVSSS